MCRIIPFRHGCVILIMRTSTFILLTTTLLAAESLAQQVTTPDGPIKGITETTSTGKTYYSFYSIPYAKPPIGSRRFQNPEPSDPWTEVHDGSTENPNVCYQVNADYSQENEDCLHMNVFTPQNLSEGGESLPVMVNIHGGGFIVGSGLVSFEVLGGIYPTFFMDEDLVFVSFNYRLGPFGFLSTGDDVIPSNLGLKDQILALKWVQRNIAAFGGDPSRVTISGQSAGAASVGSLILSPAATGLFSAAILESGTPLNPWAYQRNETEITFKMASFIDSQFNQSTDSQKLLEVLQSVDAEAIDKAGTDYMNWDAAQPDSPYRSGIHQGIQYAPVIDAFSSDPVLPDNQYELAASGSVNKVPILIGTCSEEGLLSLDANLDNYLRIYDLIPGVLVPQDLHSADEKSWNEVGNLIKQEYSPSGTFANNKLAGIQYFTDHDFVRGATKFAELHSGHSDVYYYQFSYTGTMGFNTDHKYPGSGNVTHSEEWGYLFFGLSVADIPADDQLIHRRLVRLWTNFVKYHNPTPTEDELLQGVLWSKVASSNFQYLNIGNYTNTDLNLEQGKPKMEHMAFWDSIYANYGVRPFDTY